MRLSCQLWRGGRRGAQNVVDLLRGSRAVATAAAIFLLWMVAGIRVASAQNAAPANEVSGPKDAEAAPSTDAPAFDNEQDKLSYALGVNAASQLRKHAVDVDPDLYFQGFKAQFSKDKPLLTAAEASAIVGAFQTKLAQKQKTEKERSSKHISEQNKQDGEAFLAANKSKEGVVTLPSGLQYKILKAGEGSKPTLNDTVVCNYRGTRLDGTEFSNTARSGKPAVLPVRKLMPGWREALELMPVGSKWQLAIPPHLAYGTRGAGKVISPNATLIFELELVAVKDKRVAPSEDESEPGEDEPQPGEAAESNTQSAELSQSAKLSSGGP